MSWFNAPRKATQRRNATLNVECLENRLVMSTTPGGEVMAYDAFRDVRTEVVAVDMFHEAKSDGMAVDSFKDGELDPPQPDKSVGDPTGLKDGMAVDMFKPGEEQGAYDAFRDAWAVDAFRDAGFEPNVGDPTGKGEEGGLIIVVRGEANGLIGLLRPSEDGVGDPTGLNVEKQP